MQMRRIQLWILCLLLSSDKCGSHSLEFLSTGRVQPGHQHSFEQLTVFDGVPVSYCDSFSKREHFKPTLESQNLPEDCSEACYNVLESLHELSPFVNGTAYVVQRRRGCIRSANGVVSAFETWAVNGMDFMSFDHKSQEWTSQSPSAITMKRRWNNKKEMNDVFRHFIIEKCPQLIQKIKLRSVHQKTELRVFAKPEDNTAHLLLRCHVTSTDKSLSSVHLIGDGAFSWITVEGPMPCEDGSVILRLTAEISPNQNTYGCRVQTGGHNITVFWDGNTLDGRYLLYQSSGLWQLGIVILGVFCLVLIITSISCATILLLKCEKKKKSRFPSRVDPQLIEQFNWIMRSVASPDLQNVIVSFIQGTERDREFQDKWEVKIQFRDQNGYDPDYFAQLVDGSPTANGGNDEAATSGFEK